MRARHLLPVAIVLAACGGEKTATTDTLASLNPQPAATTPAAESAAAASTPPGSAAAGSAAALADPSTVAQLDSVNTAAKAGLTKLPVAVAVPLIRSFEDKLSGSTDGDLKEIGGELGELREELGKSPVNGAEVGESLAELGPKVTKAASKGGAAQGTLSAIGAELTKAGAALQKKQ